MTRARSPRETRFRTALWFSGFSLVVLFFGTWRLDVRLAEGGQDGVASGFMLFALIVTLFSIMATALLVAALMEHRPAFGSREGRLLWFWTLGYCVTLVVFGLLHARSNTHGQVAAYGSGLVSAVIGGVGLVASAIPNFRRGA